MGRECENLLSFIADELNDNNKRKFEKHLQHCTECAKEYEIMTDAWHSLYLDIEEQKVPESLKAEVMDFVFIEDEKDRKLKSSFNINEWFSQLYRQFSPIAAALIVALMVLTIALSFSNMQLRNEVKESGQENIVPIEVLSTLSLQAADQTEGNINTGGSAVILQQGEAKSLVVQVRDLPRLEGSEVYQVWLLKNGKRKNAGIFKPDESGAGILTYELAQNLQFDQIGITVEPDQYSTEPRGKKIVGSS
ncbi:hypothetical protein F9802_03935 [Bacillus aerolatus]|uniref:Anti-sigma K factor RskA C-terminal domain-containing protein n=1 Tax=Bacillus aerolatus TaxID=2653354 RepID=A0A6I1FHT3_9BACI|nr:anti-sigma factor [Bacillus aerolatus]KAB7707872.1 hypothetical protein F9802_03935 [Bacillus aerolatus]